MCLVLLSVLHLISEYLVHLLISQSQVDPATGNGVSVHASACTALEILTFLLISLVGHHSLMVHTKCCFL